jgi:hypothetical protein
MSLCRHLEALCGLVSENEHLKNNVTMRLDNVPRNVSTVLGSIPNTIERGLCVHLKRRKGMSL